MITSNTDGAVVSVSSIFMVMRNGHHRGEKEEQYEIKSKLFVAAHGSSFIHEHRLTFADLIVNMLLKFSLIF